jgi:hypothetical protein
MSEETAYEKNTRAQYEALGRFVEAFENMVGEVREANIDLLSNTGQRGYLVQIAFHHQSLTAKPLFEIMRAIIAEVVSRRAHSEYENREIFSEILGYIEGAYEDLANMRNTLLHGTWFIG